MFGKILSIVSGLILINSFYIPWYKFVGITEISPLDVVNSLISQPLTPDSLWKLATMLGILVLGGLMILTAIFPKLFLSVLKLVMAIGLLFVHLGYFYTEVISKESAIDWINLYSTSPGFLMFIGAMIIYFFVVVFAIALSPLKGASKIIGI